MAASAQTATVHRTTTSRRHTVDHDGRRADRGTRAQRRAAAARTSLAQHR